MGRPEAKVTRAVVIEKESAAWRDVLRCDEYLKNPQGFLEGTPREPVTGWLLKIDRKKGNTAEVRDLFFTTLQSGQPMPERTIAVRWNHDADRYQSHKGNGQFLGEIATLEIPGSELR